MDQLECTSEVARLRRQIDLEFEATQHALMGFTMTAQHAFIDARMHRAWEHKRALAQEIGEVEANNVLVEAYQKTIG